MKLSQVRTAKFQAFLAVQVIAAVSSFSPGFVAKAKAEGTASTQSKTAGVELTESNDKRAQLLNQLVAPSYEEKTPEAAKLKEDIMHELEHKNEPEPFCYYPI